MYLGVDVGLTGALAVLDKDGSFVRVEDLPIMNKGVLTAVVKKQVNGAGLAALLALVRGQPEKSVYAFVERVATFRKQGIATNGSLMHSLGVVEGVLQALAIPYWLVHSQTWKKRFKLGKDKERARQLAIRLFPKASLSKKKDANRAEALLLAWYGWELHEHARADPQAAGSDEV